MASAHRGGGVVFALFLALAGYARPVSAGTFTVNSIADDPDAVIDGICETAPGNAVCTLRAAIQEANESKGPDKIYFNIAGCGQVCRIAIVLDPLPPLEDFGIHIDGTTQTKTRGDSNPHGPELELVGQLQPHGIKMSSGGHLLRGFIIGGFAIGVHLAEDPQLFLESAGTGFAPNAVIGNYIGTDLTGTQSQGNGDGISVRMRNVNYGGAPHEIRNNLISGNHIGLIIRGGSDHGFVLVHQNTIGPDRTGRQPVTTPPPAVRQHGGILLEANANGHAIGPANLISANADYGIRLGDDASENKIVNNFIGVDAQHTGALGQRIGVEFADGAKLNLLAECLIAGNRTGVRLADAPENTLLHNSVGVVPVSGGASSPPNTGTGIEVLEGADETGIGQPQISGDNVISGNGGHGVLIRDAFNVRVVGNTIGTDPGGMRAVPNGSGKAGHGIAVMGDAEDTVIDRNLISGNAGAGIWDQGKGTKISSNLVGTNQGGMGSAVVVGAAPPPPAAAIPNRANGVVLRGKSSVVNSNVVSGNTGAGVVLRDATGIEMSDNDIGTDGSHTVVLALGNTAQGILIEGRSQQNTIGPGNTIGGNGGDGIRVATADADGNTITHAYVRQNGGLGIDLGPGNGVTPNDHPDNDAGANEELNFPEQLVATRSKAVPDEWTIVGVAAPGSAVEIYIADGDPSGHGEGAEYIGSGTADAKTGRFVIRIWTAAGREICATATLNRNTSEFSPRVRLK